MEKIQQLNCFCSEHFPLIYIANYNSPYQWYEYSSCYLVKSELSLYSHVEQLHVDMIHYPVLCIICNVVSNIYKCKMFIYQYSTHY